MATKIGTCPCPLELSATSIDGSRSATTCQNLADVYEEVSGSQYFSVCTGSIPGDEKYHTQAFGPYYLVNVTFI